MNLYRSFGNLMETWVTDGNPSPDAKWLGMNPKDSDRPSSDMETNPRSESVDSGVETASCDTSLSASGSVSADNNDMDLFTLQRERLSPASSQSPVLSSPGSPQLSTNRTKENYPNLQLKVERTLQRTDSLCLEDKPKPITADEVLRRRPRAPLMPKRHVSDLVRSQRPEGYFERTVNHSQSIRQMSDFNRRPTSLIEGKTISEGLGVRDRNDLSPGLDYLEQVCQMLEDIARQQVHNRGLQTEMEALWEDPDDQVPSTEAAEEEPTPCQRLKDRENAEVMPGESQGWRYGHFRQRSASDTALSTLHLRKMYTHDRVQVLSTNDLLENEEDEHKNQEYTKAGSNKTHKNWRLKFGSFGKVESAIFSTKGQQTQPSEKNSARRRLSQLFRRRRKTLPL